jgi:hypothetical protein
MGEEWRMHGRDKICKEEFGWNSDKKNSRVVYRNREIVMLRS